MRSAPASKPAVASAAPQLSSVAYSPDGWEDGKTTVEDETRAGEEDDDSRVQGNADLENSTIDEPTVEEQARPLPPLALVRPIAPALVVATHKSTAGKLVVTAGNDQARQFELREQTTSIGRGVDNDVVLTDIAVSRRHLEILFDGRVYTLHDRGSGNGTLVNDRVEDGSCQLRHGDRIEIGNTTFRFEHAPSAAEPVALGWGQRAADDDDEIATTAGRASSRGGIAAAAGAASAAAVAARAPTALDSSRAARPTLPRPRTSGTSPPPPPGAPGQLAASTPSASARLALPALPPGASGTTSDDGIPIVVDGNLSSSGSQYPFTIPIESSLPSSGGPMSLTLPVQPYPHVLLPEENRKLVLGLVAGCVGLIFLGLLVMIIGGDDARTKAVAAGSASEAASATKDPAPPTAAKVEPTAAVAAAPGTATASAPEVATPPVVEPPPVVAVPVADQALEPDGEAEPVVEPAVATATEKQPPGDRGPRNVDKKPVDKKPVDKASTPTKIAAAKKKASGQYAAKDFRGAAATLRAAASGAESGEAKELSTLAGNYEAVGTALSQGNENATTNATAAMTAYSRALALDKKVGGSVHSPSIREKLGAVAPKAAGSYMAKGNYEQAKKAADMAVNFGSGGNPTVTQVRKSLERKAGELSATANQVKKTKPDEAKSLWRRILKIVPPDSPWYAKAYKALNTRTASRDDDE